MTGFYEQAGSSIPVGDHDLAFHTDVTIDNPLDGDRLEYDLANDLWRNFTPDVTAYDLGDLGDVDTTDANSGEFLRFNGAIWEPALQVTTLAVNDLTDTDVPAPNDAEVLTWSNASSKWIASPAGGGGGVANLPDLLDVTLTNPQGFDSLVYNGAEWTNQLIPNSLEALLDTTITSATNGDMLLYNGTAWVNRAWADPLPANPITIGEGVDNTDATLMLDSGALTGDSPQVLFNKGGANKFSIGVDDFGVNDTLYIVGAEPTTGVVIDINSQSFIFSPDGSFSLNGDPTADNNVGNRDYNDGRYSFKPQADGGILEQGDEILLDPFVAVLTTGEQNVAGRKIFSTVPQSTQDPSTGDDLARNSWVTFNFVPSSRTVSGGTGISGGGALSANQTLSVDSTVLRTTGNYSVSGTKTFTSAPQVGYNMGSTGTNSMSSKGYVDLSVSDARLKMNIKDADLESAVKLLDTVQAREFDWTGENGKEGHDYGFIAQEFEEHLPELVGELDGYKAINHERLIGILWAQNKSQQIQLNELKEALNGSI